MMLPRFRPHTAQGQRWSRAFPLTASVAVALWLGGCAAPGTEFQSTGVDPLPAEYQDFFDKEQPRNPEWMHDNTLEEAQQLVAAGQTREAILKLKGLAAQDIPKAYYELGKIWDQGKGIQADPAKAAAYYEDAVRTPSYILGHASLNLAKLSLEQQGAPYRPVLAYYLLEQAMEEEIGRDEGVVMASLLARGAEGVAADPQRALALYRQAANNGNPDAILALANAYAEGGWLDTNKARSREYAERYAEGLRERAGGGDIKAMTELAELYSAEGLLAGNDDRRLHWLTQAAQAGDPDAVAKAGREMLDSGRAEQGVTLLTQAAENGDVDAMERLGRILLEGDGLRARPIEARNWLEKAIDEDSVDARVTLGRALLEGDALPAEPQRGIRLLEQAARHDDPLALAMLGQAYLADEVVPTQPVIAARYLERAHELGHPFATEQLGALYLSGRGVATDPARGERLLREAIDQGQSGALRTLGEAYLAEDGPLPYQPREAERLLTQAVEAGDTSAATRLGEAYLTGELTGELSGELSPETTGQSTQALAGGSNTASNTTSDSASQVPTGPNPTQEPGGDAMAAADGASTQRGNSRVDHGRRLLENAAEQGDAYAMVVLGRAYRDGTGVSRDLAQATEWLERAEAAGHPSAAEALMRTQRDRGQAGDIQALIASARQGNVNSMADLGRAYRDGQGVGRNLSEASRWLERAARQGHPGAAAALGRMYLDGEGVARDPAKGAELLQVAVAGGHAGARADLGGMLLTGNGVEADPERGRRLLSEAAEAGNEYAAQTLGEAYLEGNGVSADPAEAERWLTRASDAGSLSARALLGTALVRGDQSLAQDPSRGEQLLTSAAEQGHAGAQASLGREYLRGENLERDTRQGADYLLKAARQGHETARLALAKAYLAANGLENANREQALVWLDGVMDGNSQMASQTLHDLLSDEATLAAMPETMNAGG